MIGDRNYLDELEQQRQLFDPEHQSRLLLIDRVKQELGMIPQPGPAYNAPSVFDDQLRDLIDAIPLE